MFFCQKQWFWGKWVVLTLIPMDGPSVCFWAMTAVPQVGQNLSLSQYGPVKCEADVDYKYFQPHLMGHGLLPKQIVLQRAITFLHCESII